jgi:molybdopterin converting factor small subunit
MIAEKLGKENEEVKIDDLKSISNEVNNAILKLNPALKGMTFTVAINDQIVSNWCKNDEIYSIAVLPPFAGG